MANPFVKGWRYLMALFGAKIDEYADPKVQIQQAIDSWLLSYSLMTLKGTALVDGPGKTLGKGHWDGTLGDGIGIFDNFDGEWSAKR